MITEPMMYWITRLDGINSLGTAGILLGVVVAVIYACIFMNVADGDGEEVIHLWNLKGNKKFRRWVYALFALSIATVTFVPSTKEMAMIYAVPAIVRSDFAREDLPELYDYGMDALKEQLKEWAEPAKGTTNER